MKDLTRAKWLYRGLSGGPRIPRFSAGSQRLPPTETLPPTRTLTSSAPSRSGHSLPWSADSRPLPYSQALLPVTWTVPLGQGQLRLSLYPPSRSTPAPSRRQREAACCAEKVKVEGIPPCTRPAATVEWLAPDGEVLRTAQVLSYSEVGKTLSRVLRGDLPDGTRQQVEANLRDFKYRQRALREQSTQAPADTTELACVPGEDCAVHDASLVGPLLPNEEPCCAWQPDEDVFTLFVSTEGTPIGEGVGAGQSPLNPTDLPSVQAFLLDSTEVYRRGLRIRFLQGETWVWADHYTEVEGLAAILHVYSSGDEGAPIIIDTYRPPAPAEDQDLDEVAGRPEFVGNGSLVLVEDSGGEITGAEVTPATGHGILIRGARWVQVQGLKVTNCAVGVAVYSYGGENHDDIPLTGPRQIRFQDMVVCENWEDGFSINTPIEDVTAAYEATEKVVIGDGTLQAVNEEGDLVDIAVDPLGWWPECICIEDCEIYANGEGSGSSGVNIDLSNFSSLCTIRRNFIAGAVHSEDWPSYCGRVYLGYESGSYRSYVWDLTEDPDLPYIWGPDGITLTNGGCGHVIENNEFSNHVWGQSSSGNCYQDDGNGVDLKRTGNRTYWETAEDGETRQLMDLPIVVRNNVFTLNRGPAVVVHFGCRGLHIYNNEFSYNLGNEGAAIAISSGDMKNGWWATEYLESGGYVTESCGEGDYGGTCHVAPALTSDIFIYRNMIFKNGFIPDATTPADDAQTSRTGVGQNAIMIDNHESATYYYGSFDNIWIINNTIANNLNYGLSILFRPTDTAGGDPILEDEYTFYFHGLYVVNNIFADNTGSGGRGVQVKIDDDVSADYSDRGFIYTSEWTMDYNCYRNPDSSFTEVIDFQGTAYSLEGFQTETYDYYTIERGTHSLQLEVGDSLFRNPESNDFHLDRFSICKDSGGLFDLIHFELTDESLGQFVVFAPDFDYDGVATTSLYPRPDIGADEFYVPL
jgi:hypothetical protein